MKAKIDVDELAWQETSAPFEIRGWESVLRQGGKDNESTINPKSMCRHFLFKGETGSGKTYSGMMPAIRSVLEYPDGDTLHQPSRDSRAGALVIDPKGDLSGWIQNEFGWQENFGASDLPDDRRFVFLPKDARIVDFFENEDVSKMSIPDLQEMLSSILPVESSEEGLGHSFFRQQAEQLLQGLLAVDCALFKANVPGRSVDEFWNKVMNTKSSREAKAQQKRREEEMKPRSGQSSNIRNPADPAGCEAQGLPKNDVTRTPSDAGSDTDRSADCTQLITVDPSNYFARYVDFLSANNSSQRKWQIYFECAVEFDVDAKVFACLVQHKESPAEQNGGVIGTVMNKITPLTDAKLRSLVWLNPFQRPDPAKTVALKTIFDHGNVVVYKTSISGLADECFGRALKRIFMDMTYHLKRPSKRPVAYICDEFHRYITMDEESGEQNFLDSCRAFRAIAILATQSDSSILQSLQAQQNKESLYPLQILMNNTGTKMVFRTQDRNTTNQLKAIFAEPPVDRRAHIMDVRPPSSLATGECYFSTPCPSDGRAQIGRSRGLVDLIHDACSDGESLPWSSGAKELAEKLIELPEHSQLKAEIDRSLDLWHRTFLHQAYGLRVWNRDARACYTDEMTDSTKNTGKREMSYHSTAEQFTVE